MFKKNFHTRLLSITLALILFLSFKVPLTFAKPSNAPKILEPALATVKNNLTQYDISTKFDDASKTFTSSETVVFTNTYSKNLDSLVFHLYADSYNDAETMPNLGRKKEKLKKAEIGDIHISKVTLENKEMSFTQDNQILKIQPKSHIKPNETIEVKINFTLKLPMSLNRLGYYNNVYSTTNWYPIISIYDTKTDKWDENPFHPTGESNYSDIANYNVSINIPEKMVLASTGTTKSSTNDKNNTKTYNISAEKVRDFVFIMSPNFKVITKKCNDITVNSFYLADGTKETNQRAESLLNLSIDSLKFFSNTFGKYPYKEFDTVETYVEGFAMEYPQLIQMGKYYPNYNGDISFIEEATVHEVGHQWWYVTVGNNEFKDSFLDESLNAFSTAYYFEKKYGKYSSSGVAIGLRNKMDIFKECSTPINRSVDEINNDEFGKLVYGMGALVFENLRQKVGEDKFLKILKTYYSKNTLKNATLDGLLSIIEEIGGKESKDQVVSNINSKGFYPKHLELTKTELDEFRKIKGETTKSLREENKRWLTNFKQENKNNFASFFLQALDNFDVYLIKPSNTKMSEDCKKTFNTTLNILKMNLESSFGLNIIVKDDKDMTTNELKENSLIFVGNDVENTALKSVIDNFPIDISKNELKFNDVTINNKDIFGMLTADTSKNKNNNVIILLGMDKFKQYSLLNGADSYDKQFVLNFGGKVLKGDYDK